MISRTKLKVDEVTIQKMFEQAGIHGVSHIAPLGAGEYNAVYSAKANGKEYAIKISPEESIPILTYETNLLSSELFWYKKMKEMTDIPVPEIYYSDFSKTLLPANYFIMERVKGVQLDKMELTPEEKEAVSLEKAKILAAIHKIKNDQFGYVQNGLFDDWYQAIKSMTVAIIRDGQKKNHRSRRGERLLAYIEQYKPILQSVECSMINYDLWDPNLICSREKGKIKYTLIDPERSCWGDRIADFVCLEPMIALEDKKSSLKAYNSVAGQPILATKNEKIRYAVALGYLALILEVEKYYRYTPLHFGWWRNTIVSKMAFDHSLKDLKLEG